MTAARLTPRMNIVHRGDEHEFGVATGVALRDQIHGALSALPKIETFSVHQPWWMPFSLYQRLAQRKARSALEPSTRKCYPDMAQRLAGMASGAAVGLDPLYLFHMLEMAPISWDGQIMAPPPAGCSAVAIGPRSSSLNEPMIAHNFDLLPISSSFFVLRKSECVGRHRSIQFTFAALGGTVDGINDAGLCITYNFAAVCDTNASRPPVSFAIDDALAQCSSVPDAVRCITARPRGGGAILMLADAEGRIASLELSGTRHQCRTPRRGSEILVHTNEFTTRRMRRVEPHRLSVYGAKSPAVLSGRPIFQSPVMRRQRLRKLLGTRRRISPAGLHHIMTDHGRTGKGSDNTICMHGGYWSTIASIELFPASRRMRIAYESPCQAQYVDFEV